MSMRVLPRLSNQVSNRTKGATKHTAFLAFGGLFPEVFLLTQIYRLAPSQISKLQSLIPENIGISQADIVSWQQA